METLSIQDIFGPILMHIALGSTLIAFARWLGTLSFGGHIALVNFGSKANESR